MQFNAAQWKVRAAALYAVSAWTLFGSLVHLSYFGPGKEKTVTKEEEELGENFHRVVYEGTHFKSVGVFKKDFVPYSTRIYNWFSNLTGGSGDK